MDNYKNNVTGNFDYSNMNNNSINNDHEKMNNSLNNNQTNNQYSNYNNSINQVSNSNKKNNKIIIIVGIFVLVILVIAVISLLGKSGSSNADYTCTMSETKDDIKITSIFKGNFNSKEESGSVYQLIENDKIIIDYTKDDLTDSKYESYMQKTFGSYCMIRNIDCTSSHVELTTSSLGFDTIIDRNDNKIVITYNRYIGLGGTVSKSYKNSVINSYKKDGYSCK